jgi:HEAT repeat protein/beta-lactamase regulating signal transducer with metallopeptidase domain
MNILDLPVSWLPVADAVVKATLLLAVAAVASTALRQASAALRHLIWTLALCGALALPVLAIALPRWQLPLLTVASPAELTPAAAPLAAGVEAPALRAAPRVASDQRPAEASRARGSQAESWSATAWLAGLSWQTALFAIWATGVLLIVGRVLAGVVAVQWMSYRTERVFDAPWLPMARTLAAGMGVSPRILFLRSRSATMPMAWGVVLPSVMMPADADRWPPERLRIVLLHELAHVKRRDCLTHLLAQLACAIHWFNPLAWMAARHVRTERERACDDLVLAAGTHGPDYADQLLEIARVMRDTRFPAVLAGASLAMAHRTQLEGRLIAILDPKVPRTGPSRLRAAAAVLICVAAVVPLAAVQPWTEVTTQTTSGPADAGTPVADQSPAPMPPTPAPTAAAAPAPSEAQSPAIGVGVPVSSWRVPSKAWTGKIAADAVADALGDNVIGNAARGAVADALDGVLGQDGQPVVAGDREKSQADPRLVAALTAALKDTDREVREQALHALVQMRDPSIFEPLLQALKDASPDVREQAAHGLGQLRDRRAVEPLTGALKDENPDVREQAAFALGQLRDRSAIPGLTAAMKDTDADVREQAVFALGQLRDPSAIEGLSIALKDASPDVREQAAFALGQIRDRRALEPLISALKDADADVREQAAFALGQLRDRGAVEALVIALKDSVADVREQAAFALGQLRDPRAIDGLTSALKDASADVRQQAAFALGQLAR